MKKVKEKAFLFSAFREFNKCWRSGAKARVIMESFNGAAFVNFSAYLGHPDNVHFNPRQGKQNQPKKPKKKSEKKVKRDNERAAKFQEKKRKEKEAAVTSESTSAEFEYSFASPAREDLSNLSTSPTNDSTILGQVEKLRTDSEKEKSMMDVQSNSGSDQNSEEEDPCFDVSDREEDLVSIEEKEEQKSTKKLEREDSFLVSSDKKGEKIKQNQTENREEGSLRDDIKYLSRTPLFNRLRSGCSINPDYSEWHKEGVTEAVGLTIINQHRFRDEQLNKLINKDEIVIIRNLAKKFKDEDNSESPPGDTRCSSSLSSPGDGPS